MFPIDGTHGGGIDGTRGEGIEGGGLTMNSNDHPFITLIYALLAIPLAFVLSILGLARKS